MNTASHNKLVSFIWSIADDCLRDVYVRGKYRDVILPMVVLRRLDTLLEPSKEKVLEEVAFQKNELKLTEYKAGGLRDAPEYVFYNTSKWTLQKLFDTATNSQQILQANFEDYLNGFSPNVKEINDETFGEDVYTNLATHEKDILEWCEKNAPDLNAKKKKQLLSPCLWKTQQTLLQITGNLQVAIGTEISNDFNQFEVLVDAELKSCKIKLSPGEKNTILNAVSWYDSGVD